MSSPRDSQRLPDRRNVPLRSALAAIALAVVGCASSSLQRADELNQSGHTEEALKVLSDAAAADPQSIDLRQAVAKQREETVLRLLYLAEAARARSDAAEVERLAVRLETVAAGDPRIVRLRETVERDKHMRALLADADKAYAAGRLEAAEAAWRAARAIDPSSVAARDGLGRIAERRDDLARAGVLPALAGASRAVDLEFHDAPLRAVLDTLARQSGLNFALDKDVHTDVKVNVTLHKMNFLDALGVVLRTQDLEYKAVDARTVLIYQGSQQKQREFQELVTRTFYLVNTDPKRAEAMVKTIAKAKDVYVDDRLAMLVVHDTPEEIRLVEKLIDAIDLPEPEVMLEVSVLEVSSAKVSELGLSWPSSVAYGLPAPATTITSADRHNLMAMVANPLLIANLTADVTNTSVLANPKIRARNHEKAHVQVGDRLPVFTSTSTANVGVSSAVTYLDVGLKLDLEPQVQLDNEVTIKVALEVSSAGAAVSSADRLSTAYPVNTRQATTSLRLRDGETEILAGLISDQDMRETVGVPLASEAPGIGYLFGDHKTNNRKTEVVLLITPHVIRNLPLPMDAGSAVRAGTESHPGVPDDVRIPRTAVASRGTLIPATTGAQDATVPKEPPQAREAAAGAEVGDEPQLDLHGPEEVNRGGTFQVMVRSANGIGGRQDIQFDAKVLRRVDVTAGTSADLDVPAMGERSVRFEVLANAHDGLTNVRIGASDFPIHVSVPPSR